MFTLCRPIYIINQYNETNVMQFSFNLLRIKGLYMLRTLLAYPQEALHKRHLVYYVRIMSVGCGTVAVSLQPCHSTATDVIRMQYTKCHLYSTSWGWASNVRSMKRPFILNKLKENCITLVSLYWYNMMHGQQNIKFILCIFQTNNCSSSLVYFSTHIIQYFTMHLWGV
jgi:hypothetical protein